MCLLRSLNASRERYSLESGFEESRGGFEGAERALAECFHPLSSSAVAFPPSFPRDLLPLQNSCIKRLCPKARSVVQRNLGVWRETFPRELRELLLLRREQAGARVPLSKAAPTAGCCCGHAGCQGMRWGCLWGVGPQRLRSFPAPPQNAAAEPGGDGRRQRNQVLFVPPPVSSQELSLGVL